MSRINLCRQCDTAYAEVTLGPGQVARCRCCAAVLAHHPIVDLDKALALTLATGILLMIANLTPVLGIRVAGTATQVNVWQAALAIETGWISLSALVLLITMLVVPALQVAVVLWLVSFARVRKPIPGFSVLVVLLHRLRPWGMSEVFLLGALVAVVKLSHFVPIDIGPGIWALGALTALIALLSRFDAGSWWRLDSLPRP